MLMSLVLKGLNWKFVLCYIDDILVFSSNLEIHLQHLHEVFQRLRDAKLTLKPSKCQFGVEKFTFLGHVISENGVAVDPRNTDTIQNFPVPVTQKQLRGFLGLCNYYRRFVKDFARICLPLNALLRKEVKRNSSSSDWTTDCQNAFETLKRALVSPPILRFVDMNKEFILIQVGELWAMFWAKWMMTEGNMLLPMEVAQFALRNKAGIVMSLSV